MTKFFMKCRTCGSTDFKYLNEIDDSIFNGLFICNVCKSEVEPDDVCYELEKIENNVVFENDKHRDRVIALLKKYNKIYTKYNNEIDLEYFPAFYLLAIDSLKDKTIKYISNDGIDFVNMLENQDFSSSQKLIIKLARQLFNGNGDVPIIDLIGTLDNQNWELFLQSIKLRRKTLHLKDI